MQLATKMNNFHSQESSWRSELQGKVNEHAQTMQSKLHDEHTARTMLEERLQTQLGQLAAAQRKLFDRVGQEFQDKMVQLEQSVTSMSTSLDKKREALRSEIKRELLNIEKSIVVL